MKNMSGSSPSPAQDSLALDSAQHMLEAWTRAWRDSTQGILTAGLEHLELTQSLNDKAFEMLEHLSRPATPRDMADEWLRLVRPTFETAVNGYRRINDELATCLFSAAKSLAETWVPAEPPQPPSRNLPAKTAPAKQASAQP